MGSYPAADTPWVDAARLPAPLPLHLAPSETRLHLGTLLVRDGLLSVDQLEAALAEKEESGKRLGEIVVERGWVTGASLARALAEQHELEYLDLTHVEVDPAAVALLPEKFARRYHALPVAFEEEALLVAVADPTDVVTSDDLRLALGMPVRFAVCSLIDLEHATSRMYRTHLDIVDDDLVAADADTLRVDDDIQDPTTSAPAIKLVNQIIAQALEDGASDIHFEPQAKHLVVRARIDGVTRRLTDIPKSMQAAVTARLKVMGELDIAERRVPQDGRVSIRVGGAAMDLRIAVLPTTWGEQVVLRILHRSSGTRSLADLGMSTLAADAFARSIRRRIRPRTSITS